MSFVSLLVLFSLFINCHPASLPGHFIHTNLCSLIQPEPIVYLSNYFNTKDYFFPSSYKERRCAGPTASSSHGSSIPWPTCLNGKYHCVTRYREMRFLRIASVNGSSPLTATFASAKVEVLRGPIAFGCSDFTMV